MTTTLYRFYDASGRLLYVGISERGAERWRAHRRGKSWWTEVATATVEHYDTRQLALEAERDAIIAEKPLHNVVHNGGHRHCRSTIKSEWDDPDHPFNKLPEVDHWWMDRDMRSAYVAAMLAIDQFLHLWREEGSEDADPMPTIVNGVELLSIADQCTNPRCEDAWTELPEPPISYDGWRAQYICRHCGNHWSCGWNNDADIVRSL